MTIIPIEETKEIAQSFDTFKELRPHLTDNDSFVKQIQNQQKEGYNVFAVVEDEEIRACIGFRMMTTLAWGKILYIDDLITKEKHRSKGYAKDLLDYAIHFAKQNSCQEVHLDTGYARHAAHKVYLKQGFELTCHHLALKL